MICVERFPISETPSPAKSHVPISSVDLRVYMVDCGGPSVLVDACYLAVWVLALQVQA
jgi:hypothetical protein